MNKTERTYCIHIPQFFTTEKYQLQFRCGPMGFEPIYYGFTN